VSFFSLLERFCSDSNSKKDKCTFFCYYPYGLKVKKAKLTHFVLLLRKTALKIYKTVSNLLFNIFYFFLQLIVQKIAKLIED
jgi:hypothetical protein